MRITGVHISIGGQIHSFGPDDTRETVIGKLGEPEDTGGFSRKHRAPRILTYGGTEFHFFADRLALIYREREGVPEISIKFDEL